MNPNSQNQRRRSWWLKTLHEWHWISSALCLAGMLLFALTGVTLNHASWFENNPQSQRLEAGLPETLRAALAAQQASQAPDRTPVPPALAAWTRAQWSLDPAGREAEWSRDEIYVSMPRPGGDAWLRVALDKGHAEYERTDRGWVAYLNDLHKGRNTGTSWNWFIDILAASCLVFSMTGLLILKMHAASRPFTWPLAGLGLLIPVLLALLWMH